MKIWMSPQAEKKNPSGLRLIASAAAIAGLGILLVIAGLELIRIWQLPRNSSLLILCLLITALLIFLALCLGRRSVQNHIIFFLDEENRLFALDLRWMIAGGRNLTHQDWNRMRQWAQRIRMQKVVPAGAAEILRVERMRENAADYALVCQVRRHGKTGRLTLVLMKGYEDEDWLIRELERRRGWDPHVAAADDRRPLLPAAAGFALGAGALAAVFSHPAVGRLPQMVYFPALGIAMAGLVLSVYFGVKRRRGE